MNEFDRNLIPADLLLDCFWQLDLELRIVYASPVAASMFGIPAAALVGSPLADHTDPEDHARLHERLTLALASSDRTRPFLYRTRIRHAAGHLIPLEVHSRLRLDAMGEPVAIVGLARDTSQREAVQARARQDQRRRLQDQKLNALTRLAGGMLPEFRRLLAALEARPALAAEPELAPLIEAAGARVADLAILAEQQDLAPRRLLLDPLVAELVDTLRVSLPESIALVFRAGAPQATCRLDPDQIRGVIARLVDHACRSMPGGGLIRVATGIAAAETPSADAPPIAPPPDRATITVSDAGGGLDRDQCEQLLDPFMDAARPLDLALARGIVLRHGGRLEVTSQLGQGTTFTLSLPAVRGAADEAGGASAAPCLLVVDDDPDVRRYVDRVLRAGGYEIVLCEDGVEALALLSGQQTFAAVVLDWALPGLDGRRVREQLQARQHRLPVLVISGHDREQYEALGGIDQATPWLRKPFTPTALLRAVQDLLAQADAARGS
ncbi:MAG: response regulator [Candidatus Krumholzibacteriia bacterium]